MKLDFPKVNEKIEGRAMKIILPPAATNVRGEVRPTVYAWRKAQ